MLHNILNEILQITYIIIKRHVYTLDHYALPLLEGLGLAPEGEMIVEKAPFADPGEGTFPAWDLYGSPTLRAVSQAMGLEVRARAVARIGARMGRPEKAKERKMKPPPHSLFPLGTAGGMQRLVSTAVNAKVEAEMGIRQCTSCGKNTFLCSCPECGGHTRPSNKPTEQKVDLARLLGDAMARVGMTGEPPEIKGVQGVISKNKTPRSAGEGRSAGPP